jgi:hypothetical protein
MEEQKAESADLERLCQGASPNDEPCDSPATVHCARQSPDKDLHVGARRVRSLRSVVVNRRRELWAILPPGVG